MYTRNDRIQANAASLTGNDLVLRALGTARDFLLLGSLLALLLRIGAGAG